MIVKGYKHGGLVTEYAGYEVVIRCYRSQYGETSWQWWAVKDDVDVFKGDCDMHPCYNPSESVFHKVFGFIDAARK